LHGHCASRRLGRVGAGHPAGCGVYGGGVGRREAADRAVGEGERESGPDAAVGAAGLNEATEV
jgi:hypothetical protein